jgi:hypothetical protein
MITGWTQHPVLSRPAGRTGSARRARARELHGFGYSTTGGKLMMDIYTEQFFSVALWRFGREEF